MRALSNSKQLLHYLRKFATAVIQNSLSNTPLHQNMFSFLNPATRITCGHTTRRITRRSYILKKRRRRTQYRQSQAMKIWMAMMSTLLACRVLSLEADLHIGNEMHRDLEAALRMNFMRIDAVCNQLVRTPIFATCTLGTLTVPHLKMRHHIIHL